MKKNTTLFLLAAAAAVFYFATKKTNTVIVDPVDDTVLDENGNYIAGIRGCCTPKTPQYLSI